MPIKPIDLQTLFMQLGQVGREQTAEKEGAALQGALKAAADQKKRDAAKEAVRGPLDPEGGPGKLEDRKGGQGGEGREKGREGEEAAGEAPAGEIVRDPSLGNRLDVSG